MKRLFLISILSILGMTLGFAQIDLNQEIPKDPNVIYGKLDNGMTYYIRSNATPAKRAELSIVINTGSVQEEEDQRGLAHFCEHMCFNGTKNFPKHELVDFLERTGMKFGAEVNAYTTFDETIYGITVPLDSVDLLDKGLLVLHDWAYLVSFEGEEIDAERKVIHEEWRTRQGAQTRMQEGMFSAMFHNSKYAERLPIGLMSVVDGCEYEALRRYYRDWYTPNREAVVIVGDFDAKEMEQKVKDLFGKIPAVKNPRKKEFADIPDNKEPLIAVLKDKENPQTMVQVYIKHKPFKMKTIGDYKKSIAHNLYNMMINNRLQELTMTDKPPFIYGYAGYGEFLGPKDAYTSVAVAKEDGMIDAAQAVLQETYRVKQHGFTATELEREKKSLFQKVEKAYNDRNKEKSQSYLGEYQQHYLKNHPFPGIENEYKYYKEFIDKITLEDVNKLAQEWITDENIVMIAMGIDKEGVKVPSKEDLLALLQKVKTQKLEPYVDKVSTRPLFEADKLITKPGKVQNKTKLKEFDAVEWTLSNGMKVVIKETDFKDDEIKMTGYSYGGYSLYGQEDDISAKIATDVIEESGLNGFDKMELEKLLSDKQVSVSPYIGQLSEGFSGSSSVKDFETMLQLIHLYFTKPRYDKTAYNSFISRAKSMYENQAVSPENVFNDSVSTTLASNHKRARPLSAKLLDEADYKRVHKIYRERFNDPGSFTFFFVGNINAKKSKVLIEKYLGSLPASNNNEKYRDLGIRTPKGSLDVVARKGTEPKSVVLMQFNKPFDYDMKEITALKALGKVLSIGLIEEVREKKGYVYSIGAYAGYEKLPESKGNITIYYPCSPDNIDNASNTAFELFDKIKKNGPTDVNLGKAKKQLSKELETNLKENWFWLSSIKSYKFRNIDFKEFGKMQKCIDALTKEDVQKVAKKYLNKENYIRISLRPEK